MNFEHIKRNLNLYILNDITLCPNIKELWDSMELHYGNLTIKHMKGYDKIIILRKGNTELGRYIGGDSYISNKGWSKLSFIRTKIGQKDTYKLLRYYLIYKYKLDI